MEWVKSGYKKQMKPTIDRISNKKPYLKNNVHWLPWHENRFKQKMERRSRKGRVAQILCGEVIKIFNSQMDAVKILGLSQSRLSFALNGKVEFAGGYQWKYLDI